MRPTSLLLLLAALVLAACETTTRPSPPRFQDDPDAEGLRVLFLGNSLTYAHDMPTLLEAIAAVDEGPGVVSRDESRGNYALMDHWADGVQNVLARGIYDVVVLQQGPSSLPASRTNLVEWSTRWAEEIRAHGGRPAMYMVWPDASRAAYFPDVSASYTAAADAADAGLFPVGEAWLDAWEIDPDLGLWSSDRFHPSLAGSALAALVIHAGIFDRLPPVDALETALGGLNRSTLTTLRQAAWSAHQDFGRVPTE